MTTANMINNAASAKLPLACADEKTRNSAIIKAAENLVKDTDKIIAANKLDIDNARGKINDVMIDRLTLTAERIKAMADSIIEVAELPDPLGRILETVTRPNGLDITKISVPIGVIAIIFESRPNVTSDAAALCLKSGNVCILRGGKEAINSNIAIAGAFTDALKSVGLPENAVNLVTDTSRESANEMMTAVGKIDLLIPRGGAGLIRACVENAKIPCIETGTGICHIYVDESADLNKAIKILDNAKTSRPSVCNAAEVCIVNRSVADKFLPMMKARLVDERITLGQIPVQLRLDEDAAKIIDGAAANDNDFDTEFLDFILAVKIVDDVDAAIAHISAHSTGHSDAIITEDEGAAAKFTAMVDSAAVYVNASTRFTDGGVFGLGCEIGISTQKMHARGPMGLCEMTTYKYIVRGDGQIR